MGFEYALDDDFDLLGIWWLPNQPENQIGGRLEYRTGRSIELHLAGSFHTLQQINDREPYQDIILGITANGKPCTLVDNYWGRYSHHYPADFMVQSIDCTYLLVGSCFQNHDALYFQSYAVSYHNSEEWLGHRPFDYTFRLDGQRLSGFDIVFEPHKPIRFPVESKNGNITIQTTWNGRTGGYRELPIKTEAFIHFEPENISQSFEWYQDLFTDIQRLLILLMGSNTRPRRIQAQLQDVLHSVEIFAARFSKSQVQYVDRHNMLLEFDIVKDDIEKIVGLWFSNAERMRTVYDLHFANYFSSGMFLESQFLYLARALEAFHRVTMPGKYLSDDAYEEVRQGIVQCIPSDILPPLRQSLRARLRYGNEYSLKKRLRELVDSLEQSLVALFTNDAEAFTIEIKDMRNRLTHYEMQNILTREEYSTVLELMQKARILSTILLLKSIEIDDRLIYERLYTHREFQTLTAT